MDVFGVCGKDVGHWRIHNEMGSIRYSRVMAFADVRSYLYPLAKNLIRGERGLCDFLLWVKFWFCKFNY